MKERVSNDRLAFMHEAFDPDLYGRYHTTMIKNTEWHDTVLDLIDARAEIAKLHEVSKTKNVVMKMLNEENADLLLEVNKLRKEQDKLVKLLEKAVAGWDAAQKRQWLF